MNFVKWGALAAAAALLYEHFFGAQTAQPVAASSAPAIDYAGIYSRLVAAAAADTANFTGSGDNLTGAYDHWNYWLQRVMVNPPDATKVFPGVDFSQPVTAATFWAAVQAYIAVPAGLGNFVRSGYARTR